MPFRIQKILFPTVLLALCIASDAQFQSDLNRIPPDTTAYPGTFHAGLNAAGFFNNKEFFGTGVEGYTLIGNYFQTYLGYDISNELSLKAGAHFLWYHGQDTFKQLLPVFAIRYKILPGLSLQIGSFNMGGSLLLPEPLYMFENQFSLLTGTGIRIDTRFEHWESVTWLDWQKFIEQGDPFREEFIFGHSGNITLWENEESSIILPIYVIANHKGGQINNNDEPVETRFDLGTGINYKRSVRWSIFKQLQLMADIYSEKGAESNPDGHALFTYGELSGDIFSLGLGYFLEKNWESILGEPLFFTSGRPGQIEEKQSNLLLIKTGLGKKITPGSSFMLRFEGYYDPGISKFQYSYGIHLLVNELFWKGH